MIGDEAFFMAEPGIAIAQEPSAPGDLQRPARCANTPAGEASAGLPDAETLAALGSLPRVPAGPKPTSPPPERCAAELGALRGRIFTAIRNGEFMLLPNLLPVYGALLESIVTNSSTDSEAIHRAEADHSLFFEQLKATLFTNRIQMRLELERVKASRQYAFDAPGESADGWRG